MFCASNRELYPIFSPNSPTRISRDLRSAKIFRIVFVVCFDCPARGASVVIIIRFPTVDGAMRWAGWLFFSMVHQIRLLLQVRRNPLTREAPAARRFSCLFPVTLCVGEKKSAPAAVGYPFCLRSTTNKRKIIKRSSSRSTTNRASIDRRRCHLALFGCFIRNLIGMCQKFNSFSFGVC